MKTIESFLSTRNNKNSDKGVSASFIYNYYSSSETQTKDDVFFEEEEGLNVKNKFIRIEIPDDIVNSYRIGYLSSFYGKNTENFVQDIEDISKKSLNSFYIKFFNKLDKMYSNRRYFHHEIDDKEKKDLIDFYSADSNLNDSAIFGVFSSSNRISLFENDILNSNTQFSTRNSILAENTLLENNETYQSLIKKNLSLSIFDVMNNSSYPGANYFQNLKPLNSVINNFNLYGFSRLNCIKCGFLIEKYKKDLNNYVFLTGKFVSTMGNSNDVLIKNNFEDVAVQYGQTYKYVCYEVYLYTVPDYDNRFICNRYLLCDYPYFTKDIECIETEKPKPPINLQFQRLSKSSLKITWDEPSDYQYDIKGFQILKRRFLKKPYSIIQQLEGHLTTDFYFPEEILSESLIDRTPGEILFEYTDNTYQEGKIEIYTVRSIDAHGMFSNYSEQVAILYDPFEEKIITDYISPAGAQISKPNEFLNNKSLFFENRANIVENLPIVKNPEKFTLYVTPDFESVNLRGTAIPTYQDESQYKLTVLKINNLSKFEKTFGIENFNT